MTDWDDDPLAERCATCDGYGADCVCELEQAGYQLPDDENECPICGWPSRGICRSCDVVRTASREGWRV